MQRSATFSSLRWVEQHAGDGSQELNHFIATGVGHLALARAKAAHGEQAAAAAGGLLSGAALEVLVGGCGEPHPIPTFPCWRFSMQGGL